MEGKAMKPFRRILVLVAAASLFFGPVPVRADDVVDASVVPSAPAPDYVPPAPPADEVSVDVSQGGVSGQWVYTSQYGWVWMPYGNAFVNVSDTGFAPNMYLYYPAVGWCWVVAPWVWGWGPSPFWGVYGASVYPWYGWGYGRGYGY